LPALDGALAVAATGVETDGAGHNRRSVADVFVRGAGVDLRRETLAFDPQTSGGLLAAVPPSDIDAVLTDLRAAGVVPSVVGRVEPAIGGPEVVLV
jgi:selenide,water dikinase